LSKILLISVSIGSKRRSRRSAELFRLGSFAGIAIEFRKRAASFGVVALVSELRL
jgi:hypothetical protein